MRGHVFSKLPKYCVALKPGMVWVRCLDCGTPHQEYFGPKDHDERKAEILLLRQELQVAAAILATHHPWHPPRRPKRGSAHHHRPR